MKPVPSAKNVGECWPRVLLHLEPRKPNAKQRNQRFKGMSSDLLTHPPNQEEEGTPPQRQIREPAAFRRPVLHFLHSWSPAPASISHFRGSSQKTVLSSVKALGLTAGSSVSQLRNLPFHRVVSRVILTSDIFTCFAEIL